MPIKDDEVCELAEKALGNITSLDSHMTVFVCLLQNNDADETLPSQE
jgi:hypothetical protein